LEEGWRGGDGEFHLSIERMSGRAMGMPARRLHASPGERFLTRGGSHIRGWQSYSPLTEWS